MCVQVLYKKTQFGAKMLKTTPLSDKTTRLVFLNHFGLLGRTRCFDNTIIWNGLHHKDNLHLSTNKSWSLKLHFYRMMLFTLMNVSLILIINEFML